MSSSADVPGKSPFQESTTRIPSKYELDGVVEDGDSNSSQLRYGTTRHDQKDMHRMGKDQELMVTTVRSVSHG